MTGESVSGAPLADAAEAIDAALEDRAYADAPP